MYVALNGPITDGKLAAYRARYKTSMTTMDFHNSPIPVAPHDSVNVPGVWDELGDDNEGEEDVE